ncbi:uncharacterized protein [Periplaneta americana]|uniref:uncharacterized protein isoform X6 n=1 Tax=Periplaneta americana TaxID=6978 RepID=UPI0037E73848
MLGMKRAYGRTDADRICRLCSSNSGIIVLNIFDGEGKKRRILSLINSCLPVKISENDSLPKVICHHCLHKLEVFREFQESCLKSEETLRKFSTYSVTYPAFRNASQEFIRENEETVSRFSAELLPIPVPLEQHQQQSSGAVATTVVEERSEERTGVQRREIYEHSPADQLEVIMVKEEPQEEIAAGDEDSRWQDTSIEEENVMQAEETELDLISPGDRIKSEDCGSIEPPVLSWAPSWALVPSYKRAEAQREVFNHGVKKTYIKCGRPLGVPEEIRFSDVGSHLPERISSFRRCRLCSTATKQKRSRYQCSSCMVGLCITPCFTKFHIKVPNDT